MPSIRTWYSDSKMLQPVQNFYNHTSSSIIITWNFYSYTAKQLSNNTTHFFLVLFEILGLKKMSCQRGLMHCMIKIYHNMRLWKEMDFLCEERCFVRHIYWNNKNKYGFWRDCWTTVIKGQLFDFDEHNVKCCRWFTALTWENWRVKNISSIPLHSDILRKWINNTLPNVGKCSKDRPFN